MRKTFKNGLHIAGHKSTSSAETISVRPDKGEIFSFPMQQHIGAKCEPVVSVGDYLFAGQKVGDSDSYVSAPVHSSISGRVVEIGRILSPSGSMSEAVFVENDGEFRVGEPASKVETDSDRSRGRVIEAIRDAGIVGLGGAGFPAHVKLTPPKGKKIETIILNAAECEPFITSDHRLMLEQTKKIIGGLELLLGLFEGSNGLIAVETNKPDAIKKFEDANLPGNMRVARLKPKYPQGSEKHLIYACTGREVPSGGLPSDVGCVVHNTATAAAVYDAVVEGLPLTERIVTISGGAVEKPGNYKVPLGMKLSSLLNHIGGLKPVRYKIISGGPMMGIALYTTETPVVKTSASFLFLTEPEASPPPEENCIRCGKCVDRCPMRLRPLVLNKNVLNKEFSQFKKNSGAECIECGSCSYVCPSKRHLAQSIRVYKRDAIAKKKA